MNPQRDRNVLIALMAAQLAFISHEQLQGVLRAWTQDKSQDMGVLLRQRAYIDQESLDLLLALVDAHIGKHGGDPSQSLATLSSVNESLTEALASIDDDELRRCATQLENRHSATVVGYEHVPDAGGTSNGPEIPRFSIIRRHAVGGLGEVFVAFDHELNRQVALKEIKGQHAFDTGSRQRFVLEAEITGGLEHPGIVPVYGLGTYKDGRPYYAMRFIKGSSLADTAEAFHKSHPHPSERDFRGNEFRKLLKRFTDVCYSIAYAHSRGVLHRDLKPGNIMLGKYGETLVVDWGLAKTVDRRKDVPAPGLDEETLRPSSGSGSSHTRLGQAVGTPAYMSPEAASGLIDQVGVPSDIYCLGATLYYVLTGKPPHRLDSEDKLDAVRKGEFPPPREVLAAVPKPLEAICLKAMRQNAGDRYPSANAIAEEIDLWLADEPISAYEDPIGVRLGRFVRRHKAIVTSAAVVGLLTLLGVTVFAIALNDKNRELELARKTAEDNAVRADANAIEADAQRRVASDNAETARGIALNIVEIAEKQFSNTGGQESFRESLMDRAYKLYRDALNQDPEDATVAIELAKIARLSGNVKNKLRKFDEARKLLEESIALQLKFGGKDVDSLDYLAGTYRDLASFARGAGDLELAAASYKRSSQIIVELLNMEPDNDNLRRTAASSDADSAGLYFDLLNDQAALEAATRGEAAFLNLINAGSANEMDYLGALISTSRRAQALMLLNRVEEGRAAYQEGIRLGREWVRLNPELNRRFFFARMLLYYAADLSKVSPIPEDADAIATEALQLLQLLVDSNNLTPHRFQLAVAHRAKAVLDHARSRNEDAAASFAKAVELHLLVLKQGKTSNYLGGLAKTYFEFAKLYEATGDKEQALKYFEDAFKTQKEASDMSPSSLFDRKTLLEYEQKLKAMQ